MTKCISPNKYYAQITYLLNDYVLLELQPAFSEISVHAIGRMNLSKILFLQYLLFYPSLVLGLIFHNCPYEFIL